MKTLHKFILKSYFGPFIMTFFIALFVLLMQFLWKYVDDLIGKGLEWYIITELMIYACASLVPLALPLAILLSSIMTFGNMGENYELVAMKSAGLSLQRIMAPLVIQTSLVCLLAFYFSNNILPVANLKMGTLLYDITHQKPAIEIKEGIFYNGIDNYSIRVGKKEDNGNLLKNLMIYDHSGRRGSNKVIIAESGTMSFSPDNQYMILHLFNGYSYDEQGVFIKEKEGLPLLRFEFKEQLVRMDLTGFKMTRTDEELFKDNYQMMNLAQLQESMTKILSDGDRKFSDYRKHISENFFRSRNSSDGLLPKESEAGSQEKKDFPFRQGIISAVVDSVPGKSNFVYALPEPAPKFEIAEKPKPKIPEINVIPDSLKPEIRPVYFSDFPRSEKIQALDAASNLVRSAKAYTESFVSDKENRTRYYNRHQAEWHRKLTLSFACMILFFIGAPLGAIIRKGGLGMPVVVSFVFFIVFHVISITGEKFTKEGVMEPYIGMWLASFILLPVGVFLTIKASRDSVIFDLTFYSTFLNLFKKKEPKAIGK